MADDEAESTASAIPRVAGHRPSYVGEVYSTARASGDRRSPSATCSTLGGSSASKRGSYGVGRKRKSRPYALSPWRIEGWIERATSPCASWRSSASARSTTQFEPLEPCTENIVRSAP